MSKHGIVRVDGLHFKYEDGTRYVPVGTTVYALVHQEKELVDETMESLKNSPFNKVRMCVFPKSYDYNHNEPPCFAFERKEDGKFDFKKPNEEFWSMLESRIKELDEMEIECDLILFHPYDRWGFAKMTKEECLDYLGYAVDRLSPLPNVWWSLANEYDLMTHFENDWWAEFAEFIANRDKYHHLLSNHQCIVLWDYNNEHTTHCCLQLGNTQSAPEYMEKSGKPVIYDECCYEGNLPYPWGNISGFEMVDRFWRAYTQGAYASHGEVILDVDKPCTVADGDTPELDPSGDAVLWWAKGGKLKGESPKRIAFMKDIIESLPGDLDCKHDNIKHYVEGHKALEADPHMLDGADGITLGIAGMTQAQYENFVSDQRMCSGFCGDKAFLTYCGRHCVSYVDMELPENKKYKVEVIDVWNMTRNTISTDASGKIRIKMPGIEGMAVLATEV